MLRTLLGFPGRLVAINPRETSILGRPCYPSLQEVDEAIDLAVLTIPASAVPGLLRDAIQAGVRAALICSGGFAEAGPEGEALQSQLAAIRDDGITLLGPNTSGFVNPSANLTASFVPATTRLRPGPLGIVAQSGGIHHALAFLAHDEGVGISIGVGLGNAVDVGFAEALEYLGDHPQTEVIALHVEGLRNGREVARSVAAVADRKPLVALVAGRADVTELARSHTGALAGDWNLTRSALAQSGAVVVDDLTELIDAAAALTSTRLPPRDEPGVAVVTGQAGPGLVISETLLAAGARIPELSDETTARLGSLLPPGTFQRNPVDTGRPGPSFGDVVSAAAGDPSIDLTVVYALSEPDALDPLAALAPAAERGPVVFAAGGADDDVSELRAGLHKLGIPLFRSPDRAARGAMALVRDSRLRALGLTRSAEPLPVATHDLGGPLDEHAAKELLERHGLRCPERRVCETRAEALQAFRTWGPPVVAKLCDAGVSHKSEVGGVHTGIPDEAALVAALDVIDSIPPTYSERRYLLERQAGPGVELIVGGRRDESFGPVVLLGVGGLAAEAVRDVAVRLAPLTVAEAASMIRELRAQPLLHGFRGLPPVDLEELSRIIRIVGDLVHAHEDLLELDLNPLRATSDGLLVLDAMAITEGSGVHRPPDRPT